MNCVGIQQTRSHHFISKHFPQGIWGRNGDFMWTDLEYIWNEFGQNWNSYGLNLDEIGRSFNQIRTILEYSWKTKIGKKSQNNSKKNQKTGKNKEKHTSPEKLRKKKKNSRPLLTTDSTAPWAVRCCRIGQHVGPRSVWWVATQMFTKTIGEDWNPF